MYFAQALAFLGILLFRFNIETKSVFHKNPDNSYIFQWTRDTSGNSKANNSKSDLKIYNLELLIYLKINYYLF